MNDAHIFIVGLPRTGTKLMRNVLCASPDTQCRLTPESWYLGDLFRSGLVKSIRGLGDMSKDNNVERLVELMYSGTVRGTYWNLLGSKHMPVPRQTMLDMLKASDRSERAIYEVIMRAPVVASDEPALADIAVLGDKMPGNLYHVPQLIEWFPNARIVHTFRDPRAILASEWRRLIDNRGEGWVHRLPRPLYSLAIVFYVTVSWLYAVRLHRKYTQRYGDRYRLVRYEDLVGNPEATARELCDFLDFKFDETMLQPAQFGSSFAAKGGRGFDKRALDRWREHLAPWMRTWINLLTGSRLAQFGYER